MSHKHSECLLTGCSFLLFPLNQLEHNSSSRFHPQYKSLNVSSTQRRVNPALGSTAGGNIKEAPPVKNVCGSRCADYLPSHLIMKQFKASCLRPLMLLQTLLFCSRYKPKLHEVSLDFCHDDFRGFLEELSHRPAD